MDGWSGGVRDILNRRIGGRDRDVAGLSVVEFLEEVCGNDGVVADEGAELMVGRGWGVDGRVGVSRHSLAVKGAEGVPTEGSVGLTMFEGGLLLRLAPLCLLLPGWWFGGVDVVEVPHWGR